VPKNSNKKVLIKIQKAKIVIINFVYLIFSLLVLLVIYEYLHDIFSDFARFKMMHPTTRIFMDMAVIFLWGVSSFLMYKYNKKLLKKDKQILIYIIIPFLVILVTWIFIN